MSSRIARSWVALALTLGSASDIEAQQDCSRRFRASSRNLSYMYARCSALFFDANASTAWRMSTSAKAGISLETGAGARKSASG